MITDDRSALSAEEIRSAAKPLEEKAIHVIAVGVGKSPDAAQLETMTQRKGDVLKAPKDVDPAELGERIMEKAFQRKLMIDNRHDSGKLGENPSAPKKSNQFLHLNSDSFL